MGEPPEALGHIRCRHGPLRSKTPAPLQDGDSTVWNDLSVCRPAGAEGSFRHFRACGPADLHLKHFPGWSYLLTDGETSLPLWVVPRSQGMADSYDHQFRLTPGLYVFMLGSLFLLSLFSIINTPSDISRSWGIRVCGPYLTSGDCA